MRKDSARRPREAGQTHTEAVMLPYRGYGSGGTLLPYRLQDGYTRELTPQVFDVAVIENEFLRATFLLGLGGRLWSLYHLPSKRELLDVNPVIRLANLAFRDAWFAGGVEWNPCLVGAHSALTCEPVFAGIAALADGTPVLRIWEWERRSQIAYQIDAWLPPASPFLRVRIRLFNGQGRVVPMYWWSNIAVPETVDTRVISPAESCFVHHYAEGTTEIIRQALPIIDGIDVTYPTNGRDARDYFFEIPRNRRPWIAALREDGCGLVQTSTSRQIGRKLFRWGTSCGGRRWQDFLAVPGHAYIEIQAGLAETQSQGLPMPPGEIWEWLEYYGLMTAEPKITHGAVWTQAYEHVGKMLDAMLPPETMETELLASRAMAEQPPQEILHRGGGWGALERRRCERAHKKLPWSPGLVFDDASLGPAQTPWLNLLETGALPYCAPNEEPGHFMVSDPWRHLLEDSISHGASDHWLGWFHVGVMCYDRFRSDNKARAAWEKSLELAENPWAMRCLGSLALRHGNLAEAVYRYKATYAMLPNHPRLAAELCSVLNAAGHAQETIDLFNRMPPPMQNDDRILLAVAGAALDLGDYQTALKIITSGREFACIREGENSLTSIWFRAQEQRVAQIEGVPITRALRLRVHHEYPPPYEIDLRMADLPPEQEVLIEEKEEKRRRRLRRAVARQLATCS